MDDSCFKAMASEIDGLLGVDPQMHAGWSRESTAVHGYLGRDPRTGSISFPIYQSATFAHPALHESTGYAYSRCGNPTVLELENTIALLEGGVKALAFSSGVAAISTALKLFSTGDHVLVSDDLYGGTYRLFQDIYHARYGLEFDYVDFSDLETVASLVKPNTRAFFVETPTNPMMKVADIAALAQLAHANDALLIVDNTFLTSYFQRPFEWGADLVIYSGSKYLCGHNDVICGFTVVRDESLLERVFMDYMTDGAALGPFEAWLMLRSLKTLGLRLQRQEENAKAICAFLKQHPHVTDVFYVGDPDHPSYELSSRQASGFGAMISFNADTEERALEALKRIELIAFAESLGGCESLMTYPLVQTHGSVPPHSREKLGIGACLLRLSVGIENVDDLIADLAQALA